MLERLLARTADALDRAGVAYMVIGGQAVLRHGEPRLTGDIDLVLDAALDRLDEIQRVISELGLEPLVDVESFARETFVIPCRDPNGGARIDLMLSFSPFERAAIARSEPVQIQGVPVRFATAEDLVILKVIAGRPRDLEDVRGVVLKNPGLDREWIRRWLGEYEALIEDPLVARFEEIDRATRD